MDIDQYAHNDGPNVFYNDDFRAVVEAHVDYLHTHEETQTLYLEPHIVDRYEFDLFGLMMNYKIPAYKHWIVLRMNNLYSMTNFPKDLLEIHIPSDGCINVLRQIYQTTHPTT